LGRYRSHPDDDREREFHYRAQLVIPPSGPGSAPSGSNQGPTHKTQGPYAPVKPTTPPAENNEKRPPTPEGTPQTLHAPTPNAAQVMDYSKGGAAVGFVINSQTNGVATSFPPDPSGVSPAGTSNLVMGTGNLYVKYSTDGGQTFTTISDLSTVFGDQPDGGYCCDQVLHYIPSIDRIVW
jgi:hypothetical protein